MERYTKFVVGAVLVVIVALLMWSVYAKEVGATNYPPQHKVTICHKGETIEVDRHAARAHLRLHEEDYEGACKEEPKDYCEYVEGVQGEDEDCPKPEPTCEELQNCEPETPPVVPPVVKKDNDEKQDRCEAPGKVQGFRFMFVGNDNRLRWTKKANVDEVDIKVYGPDKTTVLYTVRTQDDGEYTIVGRHDTWHRIRAVGNCGLSKWSALIN